MKDAKVFDRGTSARRGSVVPMDSAEIIKAEANWPVLARLFESNGSITKQPRPTKHGKGVGYLITVDSDDPNIPQEFWGRLRVGNPPCLIKRYDRADRKERKGPVRLIYRWRIGKQLEVYWFLTNLRRFMRGPIRTKVETSLRAVEEIVLRKRDLERLTMRDAPALNLDFSREREPGFMTREKRR